MCCFHLSAVSQEWGKTYYNIYLLEERVLRKRNTLSFFKPNVYGF